MATATEETEKNKPGEAAAGSPPAGTPPPAKENTMGTATRHGRPIPQPEKAHDRTPWNRAFAVPIASHL